MENNMELKQRDYLTGRIHSVRSDKVDELSDHFGLQDDERPNTGKELLERIQAGKYVLTDEKHWECYDHPLDHFRWRDPAKVKDQAGFNAARDAVSKDVENLVDKARLTALADAYAAFEAFQAKTYH